MTNKLIALIALIALVALTTGCWRVHYTSDEPPGRTFVETEHFFLYGLIGTAVVDVRAVCPDGASDIVRYAGPIEVVLWVVTIGIYTPAKHAITCASSVEPAPAPAPGGGS